MESMFLIGVFQVGVWGRPGRLFSERALTLKAPECGGEIGALCSQKIRPFVRFPFFHFCSVFDPMHCVNGEAHSPDSTGHRASWGTLLPPGRAHGRLTRRAVYMRYESLLRFYGQGAKRRADSGRTTVGSSYLHSVLSGRTMERGAELYVHAKFRFN